MNSFHDDLREILLGASNLTGITASGIASGHTKECQTARKFCMLAMELRGHNNYSIREAFRHPRHKCKERPFANPSLIAAVSTAADVSSDMILGGFKNRRVARARYMLAMLSKEESPSLTFSDLAFQIGWNDHTAGFYALKKAAKLMETDPEFQTAMARARAILDGEK